MPPSDGYVTPTSGARATERETHYSAPSSQKRSSIRLFRACFDFLGGGGPARAVFTGLAPGFKSFAGFHNWQGYRRYVYITCTPPEWQAGSRLSFPVSATNDLAFKHHTHSARAFKHRTHQPRVWATGAIQARLGSSPRGCLSGWDAGHRYL
jgi:hypothetical protein